MVAYTRRFEQKADLYSAHSSTQPTTVQQEATKSYYPHGANSEDVHTSIAIGRRSGEEGHNKRDPVRERVERERTTHTHPKLSVKNGVEKKKNNLHQYSDP